MRIAFLINNKAGSSATETGLAWLQQLAHAEPGLEFLLLTDKKMLPSFPENVLIDGLPSFNNFFSIRARLLLRKKIKNWTPDVLVTVSDPYRVETTCPQVILFANTTLPLRNSQLRTLKQKVAKASVVIFPSHAAMAHWQPLLTITKGKAQVITPLSFLGGSPLNTAEKMQCQLAYTEGRQFFMLIEELQKEEQLIHVLKAFSLFKRRQQTNIKLVLPFSLEENCSEFASKLATYKFREDVVITGSISVAARLRLAAAAYALLVVDPKGHAEAGVVEALQLEQPLLVPRTPSAEEVAGPSVLYTDPDNLQDLADKMMLIYKDETLRTQLILQGKEQYTCLLKNTPLQRFCTLLHSFTN